SPRLSVSDVAGRRPGPGRQSLRPPTRSTALPSTSGRRSGPGAVASRRAGSALRPPSAFVARNRRCRRSALARQFSLGTRLLIASTPQEELMSELAFNLSGEPFEVPAHAVGWRVRRMKQRGEKGAPEVVYGRDGLPLVIPIDGDMNDLRRALEEPGRLRLDPV